MTARGPFGRLAAALVAVLITVAATGAARAQGAVKSAHGDWQIRCETPPGAKAEQCWLIQEVTAEDRPDFGLTVVVFKLVDTKKAMLRVRAPLGSLLWSGLGLRIDGADIGSTKFRVCDPKGCIAEVVMEDELLKKFRTGTTANFIVFQTPEFGISTPIALKGFGEGFDALP